MTEKVDASHMAVAEKGKMMTYEKLKALAKEHGYDLIKTTPKEKLLPCTCGHNRREHFYSYSKIGREIVGLRCKQCGKRAEGNSERDAIKKWNEMVRGENGC